MKYHWFKLSPKITATTNHRQQLQLKVTIHDVMTYVCTTVTIE